MSYKETSHTVTAKFKDHISKSLRDRYVDCNSLDEALHIYDDLINNGRSFSLDLIEAVVFEGSKEVAYFCDNTATQ